MKGIGARDAGRRKVWTELLSRIMLARREILIKVTMVAFTSAITRMGVVLMILLIIVAVPVPCKNRNQHRGSKNGLHCLTPTALRTFLITVLKCSMKLRVTFSTIQKANSITAIRSELTLGTML
jgi:hypothetical protein